MKLLGWIASITLAPAVALAITTDRAEQVFEAPGNRFGDMTLIGDLDQDGWPDYVASGVDPGSGEMLVYGVSSRTGETLYAADTGDGGDLAELAGSVVDRDGDGVDEFLRLSAFGFPTFISLHSGLSGQALARSETLIQAGSFPRSVTVAELADATGDAVPELGVAVVGASFWVLDGVSLQVIHRQDPAELGIGVLGLIGFPTNIDRVTDADGDGVDDFVVASNPNIAAPDDEAVLYRFSGATFELIDELAVGTPDFFLAASNLGSDVRVVDDMNGDGRGELLVASSGELPESGFFSQSARVEVYLSGSHERLFRTHLGFADASALALVDDVDGDGYRDFAVGGASQCIDLFPPGVIAGPSCGSGSLTVYSSWSGRMLQRFAGTDLDDRFGTAFVATDLDANGRMDYLVSAPPRDDAEPGTALVYRMQPAVVAERAATGAFSGSWFGRNGTKEGQGIFTATTISTTGEPALTLFWARYDDQGKPLWLIGGPTVLPAESTSVRLDLYVTSGGEFGDAFDSETVSIEHWGDAYIQLAGCNEMDLNVQRDDGATDRLVLQPFLPTLLGVGCSEDVDKAVQAGHGGIWWNAGRAGEGLYIDVVEQESGTPYVFLSWFTYVDGEQLWIIGGNEISDGSGTLIADAYSATRRTDGSGRVDLQSLGSVSVDFSSCREATLVYELGDNSIVGVQEGSIAITSDFTSDLIGRACND